MTWDGLPCAVTGKHPGWIRYERCGRSRSCWNGRGRRRTACGRSGAEPSYLVRLLSEQQPSPAVGLRAALRGDCHTHSDWSDGGSPPLEMAEAARDLGHEWIALT